LLEHSGTYLNKHSGLLTAPIPLINSLHPLISSFVRGRIIDNASKAHWLVVLLLLSLAGCGEGHSVLEETFEQAYSVPPTADVNIRNSDGAVLVYGSDANEVRINATKKAYTWSKVKQIAVDVSVQPNSISIDINVPPKPRWAFFDRSGTVDCIIVVPATVNISKLRLDAGEILLDGMRGASVHAALGDGRMMVRNCFSDMDLELERGNLTVSYTWWQHESFSIHANIKKGNACAFLPSEAAFHLIAETEHGRIVNDFDNKPVLAGPEPQQIDALIRNGGRATIKMRAERGDVKIVEANP